MEVFESAKKEKFWRTQWK